MCHPILSALEFHNERQWRWEMWPILGKWHITTPTSFHRNMLQPQQSQTSWVSLSHTSSSPTAASHIFLYIRYPQIQLDLIHISQSCLIWVNVANFHTWPFTQIKFLTFYAKTSQTTDVSALVVIRWECYVMLSVSYYKVQQSSLSNLCTRPECECKLESCA